MHITKKFYAFLLLVILLFALTGCFDLGTAYTTSKQGNADEEVYYDAYGSVYVLDSDGSSSSYSMSDFYSKETVNDFECAIDSKQYTYLGVEVKKDLKIGEIVVYFNSPEAETIGVSFYIVDKIPTKITFVDELGVVHNLKGSDEPAIDQRVGLASTRLEANKWNSIYLKRTGSQSLLKASEGQFLLLRIENNCYDTTQKELLAAQEKLDTSLATYNADKADYDNKLISGTEAEKASAKAKMDLSLSELQKAQEEYNQAMKKAEEQKSSYTTRVSIKITDILIYAE